MNLRQSIENERNRTNGVYEALSERIDAATKKMKELEAVAKAIRATLNDPLNLSENPLHELSSGRIEPIEKIKADVATIVAEHEKKTGQKLVVNGE